MQNTIAQQIATLIANKSVTFAQIAIATIVPVSAKNKHVHIVKHTTANVQLFANIACNPYVNAVQKTAAQNSANNACDVANFVVSDTWFEHTDCYSIVKHKSKAQFYLYAAFNNSKSIYMLNNTQITKEQAASYCTASVAANMLNKSNAVYNKTNNVTHNAIVRTIALENIVSINACKQQVVF